MKAFPVLDRSLEVGHPYFLEASAGTGKTFAIEHLVTRYLLELDPPTAIERLLVVTFTRAATRELRSRIRHCLERVLEQLSGRGGVAPDYVQAILERGKEEVARARWRLGQALASFDGAMILTIHGFCYQMLQESPGESGGGIDLQDQEMGLSYQEQLGVVHDFFRTGLERDSFSPAQLRRALGLAQGRASALARLVLREMGRGRRAEGGAGWRESLEAFRTLLASCDVEAERVVHDFEAVAPSYVGLCDRDRCLKRDVVENVEFFSGILSSGACTEEEFERLIDEPILLLDRIANGRLRRGHTEPEAPDYPWLYTWLREKCQTILDEARLPRSILVRIVAGAQEMLGEVMEQEQALTFDAILQKMDRALESEQFCDRIRERFDGVVVDEFQDTDPLQWGILQRLFVGRDRPFVVVGDPKQSIYAFRSADIYSYLSALKAMGEESLHSLGVNYRSRPGLVRALNALFGAVPDLMELPRLERPLTCPEVGAGREEDNALSRVGAVQFVSAESEEGEFFSFIVEEIARIREEHGVSYSHFAVLIKDRFQAARFRSFASLYEIPVAANRGRRPADSPALPALYRVLRATLDPSDPSRVRLALSSSLMGWGHERLLRLVEGEGVQHVAAELYRLREVLVEKGFMPFYDKLLASRWGEEESLLERLLRRPGGLELYRDLTQLAELIGEEQRRKRLTADRLLAYFEELRTADEQDEQSPKLYPQNDEEAVHLMTTFASKGLEFGVVFALGLASRSTNRRRGLVAMGDRLIGEYPSEEARHLAERESDAEKARLLYVGLTRAKDRVYVPMIEDPKRKPPKVGEAAPVDLLLARVGDLELLESEGVAVRKIELTGIGGSRDEAKPDLYPPSRVEIVRSRALLQSFTSLSGGAAPKELRAPCDIMARKKTVHTLPAGAATGLLIHELLEKAPADLGEVEAFVKRHVQGHQLKEWSDVILEIVLGALQTPIDGFTIADVDRNRIRAEMEFMYGVEGGKVIADRALSPGCVTGVIDLFFEHGGRYYLLDWKSNWLGPDSSYYGPAELEAEMEHHHYGLQAGLYVEALERYLTLTDGRPFADSFGGVFYVFVRGGGVYKWG